MSSRRLPHIIATCIILLLLSQVAWGQTDAPSPAAETAAADSVPEFRILELLVTGNTAIDSTVLRDEMDSAPGQPFSEARLRSDIARLLALYDRSGYPFAAVRITRLQTLASGNVAGVRLELTIDEGELLRIHEITVEGNTLTDADVIMRETRIVEGEIYDAEKIGDIRRRLERLQYFSTVREPEMYLRDDSIGGVLLGVVEGNTNRFDGVVGYQPAQGSEENGYFTGLVDVRFGNLFGTGRQLDARWERSTQEVSELALHYLEPWLFSLPLNVAAGFFQRQQDSAYVRRSVDGEISLLVSTDVTVAATVEASEVIPSAERALPGLYRGSTLSAGLQLRIDTRDDVYNPRSGIYLRNAYSGGDKRFTPTQGGEVRDFLQRIEVDAEYVQELVSRSVLSLSLHGRELKGDQLDQSDLYRVGGANTLRGYREEQFSATRAGWINSELRYSLGRRTFAFVFFDFGYIYQSPDIDRRREEVTAFRNGYGLGARIETALGIMGVSYALGKGDGLSQGKIHFGLINAF
jgi:outer membrane protein insertion porin family